LSNFIPYKNKSAHYYTLQLFKQISK